MRIANARLSSGADAPLCDLWIEAGRIARVEPAGFGEAQAPGESFDAGGRAVVPGFVDCHTHACFAGDRLDEWEKRLAGAGYLELLKAGGGIMATVRATRKASEAELAESLLARLHRMLAHGTATVEVKSGYGLDTESELKMLRAIHRAAEQWPGTVAATACIGHAIDPDRDRDAFVRATIEETLPAVTSEFPGIAVDGYCEKGAWGLEETLALADAAREAGHPVRLHADQFNALGIVEAAGEHGLTSADHLEATNQQGLKALAESGVFGVMLPASGLHTDERYADGRAFLDAGGKLAIASNYNPGSAPCGSMPFVIALAVRKLGISIDEAFIAATKTPAALLDFGDRGRIEPGARADLVILDHDDRRMLAYEFGGNPVARMMVGGKWIP